MDADGTNILDVLNSSYVDIINTFSNDVHEMNQTFGIEAARELLIEQMEEAGLVGPMQQSGLREVIVSRKE